MPLSIQRFLASLVVSSAIGLAACSSPEPTTLVCGTEAECPSGTRCIARGCVANSPPAVAVALPAGDLEANLLHSFDGSASVDPDVGDFVASFAWIFRAIDAPCAPPSVAGTGPVATVRFACPGRYVVELSAIDSMAFEGTTSVEFVVVPHAGPALVVAGTDVSVAHACTASPLRCAPAQAVVLGATAPGFAPEDLSFVWTAEAPAERPLDGSRRVTFQPDAYVPSPVVVIETDGTGISGDWIFRVVASDAAGVLGTAAMRVGVGNRPPVVSGTVPAQVNHAFAAGAFTASGQIAVTVFDPDGDPLIQRSAQWRHSGDGPGGGFAGVDQGSELTFAVTVPYAIPADALHLIGNPGLERFVELAISDVNGARSLASWPIVVANRPPALVATPAPATVDHAYDPGQLAYRASASLSTWSDPDGDPLFTTPGAPTGDPQCAVLIASSGLARAECSLAFIGTPAVANFAGTHVVTQFIEDPWAAAPPVAATFTIGNRAPAITSTATHVAVLSCDTTATCCQGPPSECTEYISTTPAGLSIVPSRWSDPDGDPLAIQVTANGAVTPVQPLVCTPATCALQLQLAGENVCGSRTTIHSTTVGDGLASAAGTLSVQRLCL